VQNNLSGSFAIPNSWHPC